VAAQLTEDKSLIVRRIKGRLGELRVAVDDVDVVKTNPLWYPTPTSVIEQVREHLAGSG
jgi:hypothetical protein